MRGKDQPAPRQPCLFRITPAYAGKSHTGAFFASPSMDHPRLCGEKYSVLVMRAANPGITPAYAGKSLHTHTLFRLQGDHPRLCGEKNRLEF